MKEHNERFIYENEISDLKLRYKSVLLNIDELYDDTVRNNCKVSECYGKRYSCPPHIFNINHFGNEFNAIFAYLLFREGGDIKNWYFLADLIYKFGLRIEKDLKGPSFTAGSCRLCEVCQAEGKKPCLKPDEMRYSFTGTGLSAALLGKIIGCEIWAEGYVSASAGCLTRGHTVDHEMLFRIFCEIPG